jgi:predicted nucleotidyltransferase
MLAAISLPSPKRLAAFCREHGIQKLQLFGSANRQDFDPDRSDIDLLVEYAAGRHPGLGHFSVAEELSALFGRKVDLATPAMLGRFLSNAQQDALTLYVSA